MTTTEDEMREKFGDEMTSQHLLAVKGGRALLWMREAYMMAEPGSPEEDEYEERVNKALEMLQTRPGHSVALVQMLLSMVVHMKLGGTFEEWFRSLNLDSKPTGTTEGKD